jgi:hypothetical protein
MPKLVSDGLVKRDGQGWLPAGAGSTATAGAGVTESSDSE